MKVCSRCGRPKVQTASGRWRCRPCENAYQQAYYHADPERKRRQNRDNARKRRLDPATRERMREIQKRCWENGGRDRNRAYRQLQKREDFFGYHVQFVRRYNVAITKDDLVALWAAQDGLCGLTGERLQAVAGESQIDHVVPVSRGGGHGLDNLRWVTRRANQAKRDLTDEEFVDLCLSVAEWIGRRLIEATA